MVDRCPQLASTIIYLCLLALGYIYSSRPYAPVATCKDAWQAWRRNVLKVLRLKDLSEMSMLYALFLCAQVALSTSIHLLGSGYFPAASRPT